MTLKPDHSTKPTNHEQTNEEPDKTGRPTLLTPELQQQIVTILEQGRTITDAAALCGIGRRTIHRWLADGELDNADEAMRHFWRAVTHARAKGRAVLVDAAFEDVRGGFLVKEVERPDGSTERQWAPPNGMLALKMLERMDPEHWRPVKAVEVTGAGGGPVAVSHGVDLEGLAERVARAAREAAGGGGGGEAGS
ncbi:Helix-turn-helix domain of resolvase [Sinosporangium album]|uniref:Helix-turn-helix domain of resolvase n=1 Tax=Sinosporangium album TaxID=504805 RepID=A0A1G8EJM1_9ACTN|nr:helix-turn-helix domain-containing protein [Sinosporangium album]SDH70051.1 Helix-turn-helix domain of resolvase [Sinosporangium album]